MSQLLSYSLSAPSSSFHSQLCNSGTESANSISALPVPSMYGSFKRGLWGKNGLAPCYLPLLPASRLDNFKEPHSSPINSKEPLPVGQHFHRVHFCSLSLSRLPWQTLCFPSSHVLVLASPLYSLSFTAPCEITALSIYWTIAKIAMEVRMENEQPRNKYLCLCA